MAAYLPTFVVRYEHLRLSKSLYLSPAKLIALFSTIMVIASLGTLIFIDVSPIVIWLGTIMIAFGLSPYFGNVTIWGVQYIVLTHN